MTVPPEAVTAAAIVLHDEACDEDTGTCGRWNSKVPGGYDPQRHIGYYEDRAREVLGAAAPLIAAAERERIYDLLGHDHYVIFTEDRWTVEHSVECKLSGHMHECRYHEAIALIADEYDPATLGRWRIDDIDDEGLPSLTRADNPTEGTPDVT
jgi:hypothetical protein